VTERVDGVPDWRGLLDLLEADGEASYEDLWREWVARPDDLPLLAARAAARDRLDEVTAQAGDWRLPIQVRDAMRAWQFEDATALLDQAASVLDEHEALLAAATAVGLTPSENVEQAFEDEDGFEDATTELAGQFEVVDRYQRAVALRPVEPPPLQALGLWGTDPEGQLQDAADAFATGDLASAATAADTASALWTDAESVGIGRAGSLFALTLAAIIAIVMLVASVRRRRGRRERRGDVTI